LRGITIKYLDCYRKCRNYFCLYLATKAKKGTDLKIGSFFALKNFIEIGKVINNQSTKHLL